MNVLAVIGALLIGLSLGVFGAGGSVVTTPLLIYVIGEPIRVAIAESLLIVGMLASYGAFLQIKQRNIDFAKALRFLPACLAGTLLGSQLASLVSADTQLLTFAVVAAVSSFLLISPKDYKAGNGQSGIIYLAGLFVGALAGFVGVGGGFLIVPALIILLNTPAKTAISTSVFVIAVQSLLGFASYNYSFIQQGININWSLIALVTLCGIVGIQVGNKLNQYINQAQLKRLFGCCLALISGFILINHYV